jgi:hypothetical protein
MNVARISIIECKTEDDMASWLVSHRSAVPYAFKTADFHVAVQTGPTSGLIFSLYPSDEAANATAVKRKEFLEAVSDLYTDSFFYEGEVKTYVNGKGQDLSERTLKEKDLNSKVDELKEMVAQLLARKQL